MGISDHDTTGVSTMAGMPFKDFPDALCWSRPEEDLLSRNSNTQICK